MTDLIKFGKKAFTMSVVVMTIMWAMGAAAFLPTVVVAATTVAASEIEAGDLVQKKGDTSKAVYIVTEDMERMYFPNAGVFNTWYANFDDVKVVDADFDEYWPPATNAVVGPRPGSSLLYKNSVSNRVYAMSTGNKRYHIANEAAAIKLFGTNWASKTYTWPDYVMSGWTLAGEEISAPYSGYVAKHGDKYYQVVDSAWKEIEGDLPSMVEAKELADADFDALEIATGTVTATSLTSDPTQVGGTVSEEEEEEESTAAGTVKVSLSGSTPSAAYVAKGAYNAEYTKLSFAVTGGDVRVDKLVIKRGGLGADADITAIRLYDGAKQVGSDQALNTVTHEATFKNLNWDLEKGDTKTLTVMADTYASAAGTNDYLELKTVELEGEGTLEASLPIAGNAMQYHTVTVAVVDVNANASPAATTLISGATEQEIACYNVDVNASEGVYLKGLTFTNNDTIGNSELSNFVLKVGTEEIGRTSDSFGSDNKVTVDMTEDPFYIKASGSKNVCVYADIAGGITVTKYIKLQIAEAKHVIIQGEDSKAQVVVTVDDAATFTAQDGAQMTVGQGGLTVTRNTATLPVSTSLVDGVEHNKIATYKFSAGSTEGLLVTRLRLTVSSGIAAADWSNFELYVYNETTGVETQVGGSQSISGGYVTFEDTSDGLFEIAAGKNVVVHVYTDVNTSAAWTDNSGCVYIGSTNSNLIVKAKGVKSNEFIPAGSTTLTSVDSTASNNVLFSNTNTGVLTVSLSNDSPGATSVSKGSNDYDFTHVKLYATGEDILVSTLVARAYEDSSSSVAQDVVDTADNGVSNVRLYDITDAANPVQLGVAVSSPSTGIATFGFNLTVPKEKYKVLKIVSNVPTNAANVSYIKFAVTSTAAAFDDITATGASSGVELAVGATGKTGSAVGKSMTVDTTSLVVSWASGVTNNVVANAAEQHLGTLQLTAGQYENVKVTSVRVRVDDATALTGTSSADSDLTGFMLVDAEGNQFGTTKNLTGGTPDYVLFEGISNLTVTKGTTKNVYVKANVAGTSGTYYVGTTATTDVVGAGVVSGADASVTGTGNGWANTIQSVATLTFALDASNPLTKVVSVGSDGNTTETDMLVLAVDSAYEDVDVTKLVFQVVGTTGDNVHQYFKDSGLKLYHQVGSNTETLVGSATFVSSTTTGLSTYYTATFAVNAGDLRVGKNTTDKLTVKALLKGASTGLLPGTSPLVRLGDGTNADDSLFVEAKGVSSNTALDDGQFNGSNGLNASSNLTGNQIKVYKSYPTFTYVNPGTTIVSGVENDIYSFKVKANGGEVALKQLQFTMDIVDNVGTIDNSILVHTFKFYRGDTNLTDNVKIHMASTTAEASLESASLKMDTATGTGKIFYVTWTGTNEELISSGTEYTYTLKAVTQGFNTNADDDYLRVRLNNNEATTEMALAAEPTFYLSPWNDTNASTGNVDLLTLDDYTLDSTGGATTSTASLVASIIWSDRSSASTTHSAATGTLIDTLGGAASSSGDWYNGYYLKDVPTNYSYLYR